MTSGLRKATKKAPLSDMRTMRFKHCKSKQEAENIKASLKERLKEVGLELHEKKTSIVHCWDSKRKKTKGEKRSFDFLGYTFCPRRAVDKRGNRFTGFLPAMSKKAQKDINKANQEVGDKKEKQNLARENS